jgi:gliding motility-associated-like protein
MGANAQTDNYGTEFWTGFMSNYTGELKLYISAKQNSKVVISIPLKKYTDTVTILKDSVVAITLPNSSAEISTSEVIEGTGIHIVSDFPVSVSAMNLRSSSTDATVVLPNKNIPINATYVTGHPSKSYFIYDFTSLNEFLLVSPEDSVIVEITPAGKTIKNRPADSAFIVVLNEGNTYQVQSNENLDGSTIKVLNGKKLIVYTGDRCSNFPSGACDHQVEQLFPNQLLGSVYYALPQFGHTNGYVVKLMSIDGPISIDVNGSIYNIINKNRPILIDVPKEDSVLKITGPRNFSVFQFLKGTADNKYTTSNGYPSKGFGDPSMVQLISTKFMTQKSTFSTINSGNLIDHFVTVIIPTVGKYNVHLDYTLINPSEFIKIQGDTNFSYAKFKLGLGTHTVTCNHGHLAYCYGVGGAESYMYSAGFSLPNFDISIKDTILTYNCKDSTITMRFEAKLQGAVKSYHWDFGDGSPIDTAKIVTHSYKANEDFYIKLWAINTSNKTDSIVNKYKFSWPEFNPVFDKLLCDPTYIFKETNRFFANFKWHDNSTGDSFIANKTEQIWVSATDTSGFCTFYDTAQITKIDVYPRIFVDTLSNCYLNNEFVFSDSSQIKGDSIKSKVWTFPGGANLYDTSNFAYHINTAGDLKVYLDLYPHNYQCKARIEIPVKVNWNTDIDGFLNKEKYCDEEELIFTDNSYSCCHPVSKYYWQVPGDSLYTSTNGIFNVKAQYDYATKNGIKKFNYITETAQGCRDTLKSELIVWAKALAKFDMGADSLKCLSASRWTFIHTVDEDISGPYKMYWNFGNGITSIQNQYKNMRYSDTGSYIAKLITTTDIGCIDSVSKKIQVVGNTVADFRLKDSLQCFTHHGFEVIDNSKGVELNYWWDFGNGKTFVGTKPGLIEYDSFGAYSIKLQTTSNNSSCPSDSVIRFATILKNPKADFNVITDSVCFKNNAIVVINTSIVYNGKNKYYWQYEDISDSVENPGAFNFKSTGKHNIQLIVKDNKNCLDTTSKVVTVFPNSNLQLHINDSVQCFGINQFIISTQSSEMINTYNWYLDGSLADNKPELIISNIPTAGRKRINLISINEYNCIDSITDWIRVLPAFKADFKINKDTQCLAVNSFDFTDNSIKPIDAVVKQYYSDNSGNIGNGKEIKGHNKSNPGSYEVSYYLETENACKDSAFKSIVVIAAPTASFDSDSVCLGQSVQLHGYQNTGTPIVSWQWQMGDGQSTSGNSVVYQYKNAGVFIPELRVTDTFGCFSIKKGVNQVYPLPNANFNYTITGSSHQYTHVHLLPYQFDYPKYNWFSPTDLLSSEESPLVNLPRFFNDSIRLVVQSAFGCESQKSIYLYVYPPLDNLFIPNAFTPDGNGQNDHFKPGNIEGATDYTLTIINRWGEILFVSHRPDEGWDGSYKGKNVQDGIYLFIVHFLYADGQLYNQKGTVHIIR